MVFQPVNDDHAIQGASFIVTLDKNVPAAAIDALVKSPLEWRSELPAIDFPQLIDLVLNPQTGVPANRLVRGVEFSHKRPNGTASWQLSLVGREVKIETSLYTRWDAVWAKAGDILMSVVGQLGTVEQTNYVRVTAVNLIIADVFHTTDMNPDYSELFAANDLTPAGVYKRSALWHCNTGWFDEVATGKVLNQLNIGVGKGMSSDSPPVERITVTIQHNQILNLASPLSLKDQEVLDAINQIPSMHTANKDLLRSILTPQMQNRIKLNA